MISIMSIATILIFGIFINQLMVSSQRSRIHDLSLMQLRQTSKDVEMRLDVLQEERHGADTLEQRLRNTYGESGR